MNILYHATIGVAGEALVPSNGLFLFFSVAPDIPLIINEIRLLVKKQKFDQWSVPSMEVAAYHCTHSLFFSLFLLGVNPIFGVAHLIHIVSDWFTHTGRFASRPFYPVCKYQIKFGREILK